MNRTTAAALTLAASIAALVAAPVAGATTYSNDTPIVIPSSGLPSPYPSSITVTGTAGPITDVNVGLDGFSHTVPDDVGMVLVAPGGQALAVFSCAGDQTDAFPVFVTLDDAAASFLPNTGALTTGTFKPTSHCGGPTRGYPNPGPQSNYSNPGPGQGGNATFASVFNGTSAIGTWNLFVVDYGFPGDSGSIPGGWTLDIKPDVTPPPTPTLPPGLTCGTGTVQSGSQCVGQRLPATAKKCKKKPKKRCKRRKK